MPELAAGFWSLVAIAMVGASQGPDNAPTRLPGLSALIDSVMRVGMADERIPGAAVLVMDRGRIILERGYGVADVATRRPVMPKSTRWPFASITKVITATALMQLVANGKVNLDTDVNTYLKAVQVPATPGSSLTSRHLLTHTDALDELPGRRAESRAAVQPLAQFLRTRLVPIGPPGRITRYGSYGIALAGVIIEDVSELPYPRYLEAKVFEPLGMARTTIDLPTGNERTMATPYERTTEGVRRTQYEWYHTTPTSSVVSTISDMARFMALHLGSPSGGFESVLSSATVREMAARHAGIHPAVPGWGYGWQQDDANGRRIIEHGGDIGGFASLMSLLPDEELGLIVVHHLEGSNLRFAVKAAILNRYFPDRRQAPEPVAAPSDPSVYTGTWLANNYCRTCPDGARNAQRFDVTSSDDGSLSLWGMRWREIGPLLFATEDGRRRIGFMRDDATGEIVAVSGGAWRVLERAPPGGQPR